MDKIDEINTYKECYENRIVIADSSPLISLNEAGKILYLKLLFGEIYTTKTVVKECKGIKLPNWIRVEKPNKNLIKIITHEKLNNGEKSAIALITGFDITNENNIFFRKNCLILDEREVNEVLDELELPIVGINTRDLLAFSYDKKLFKEEELGDILNSMKGRKFSKEDIDYILGNRRDIRSSEDVLNLDTKENNSEPKNTQINPLPVFVKRLKRYKYHINHPFFEKLDSILDFILDNKFRRYIQKIFLFGSFAYGKPHENSDIDICVIIDDSIFAHEEFVYLDIKKKLLDEKIVPCDLLIYSESKFNELKNLDKIESIIDENGDLIYERK